MTTNKLGKRLVLVWLLVPVCFMAGCAGQQRKDVKQEAEDYLHAKAKDMQRWREMRFGMFVHWGPVSLEGTEIGWSRGGKRPGSGGGTGRIPVEVYDNLYTRFNPVKFDADEWIQLAKDSGMKYFVFTTKHHDGFSMFDSKLTDYKITNSPFKRDVVKELADACHRKGVRLGFYYSPPDWYHPDFLTENNDRYIKFLHGQLRELMSNYGKVDIMWFDGLGGRKHPEWWDSKNMFKLIRSLQPNIVINNRGGLAGDHGTPEQKIGNFQNDRDWETCMTIGRQWAWKPNDNIKSLKQCLQTLVLAAGGDGNFLFNVGPMPDGRIEPGQADTLREMGKWLKKYGESIYKTRGGPFKPGKWGASTYKGKKIYVHILNWQGDSIVLPAIDKKIVKSSILTGGKADVEQTEEGIKISIPNEHRRDIDTIVVLKLKGRGDDIAPLDVEE